MSGEFVGVYEKKQPGQGKMQTVFAEIGKAVFIQNVTGHHDKKNDDKFLHIIDPKENR